MVKQVIVVRKDLNMRKGKIAAQVAHASIKVFFDRMSLTKDYDKENTFQAIISNITEPMREWMVSHFTKVVVGVNSEEELYEIANKAKKENIPFSIMIDNGFTEFHGNKTTTCIAIGPDVSTKIDKITGNLNLI